jgi:hypothetical protein
MRSELRLAIALFLATAVWCVGPEPAAGQRRGRGEFRGGEAQWGGGPPMGRPTGPPMEGYGPMGQQWGDGGPGGSRFRGRWPAPEDMARRMEEGLKRMDANQNGLLEAEEVGEGGRRRFVEGMAQAAGMEPKFPMSIKQLQDNMRNSAAAGGPWGPGRGDSSDHGNGSNSNSAKQPLVPGFGVQKERPTVPGFGEPASGHKNASATPSAKPNPDSPSQPSSGGSSPEANRDYRRFARSLLRQYDKNGNGVLEEPEWREMRQSHWAADSDGDKVITVDELSAHLVSYSSSGGGG